MANIKMEAEIIFEPHVPNALRQALEYAGEDGFVASMPQLLHARTYASYDNIIWNTWFTSNSEESVVTTPQGNRVVVAVHGGGSGLPLSSTSLARSGSSGNSFEKSSSVSGAVPIPASISSATANAPSLRKS